MAAAGDQLEVFPAFRIDARFLTCYGKVPDGYIGVIILPPPAATVNAAAGVVLQEYPELLDTFLDLDIHPDSSAATIKSDVLATLDPVSIPDRRKGSSLSPPGCLKSSSVPPPLLHPNPGPGNGSSRNPDPHNESYVNLELHHGHPDKYPTVLEVRAPQTPIDVSSNSDLGNGNESSGNTEGSQMRSDKGSKWSKREDAILQQHALQYTGLGALERKIDWTPLLALLPGRTWKAMEGRWYGTLRKSLAAAGVLVDRKAAKCAAIAVKNKRLEDNVPAAKRAQELAPAAQNQKARYHAPGSRSLKNTSKKVQGSAPANTYMKGVIFKIKNEVVEVLDTRTKSVDATYTEENDVGDLPPKKGAGEESPEE